MKLETAKRILKENGYRINEYINEELSTNPRMLQDLSCNVWKKLSKVRSDWDVVSRLMYADSENNNKAIEHINDIERVLDLLTDAEYQIQTVKSIILR